MTPNGLRLGPVGYAASVALFVTLLSAAQCGPTVQPMTPGDSVRRLVLRWMQCDDCRDQQRERVIALGVIAVPYLRHYLITGPPPAYIAAMRATLFTPDTAGLRPDSATVVRQLANYDATYRTRAARTLEAIAGPGARAALCAATSLHGVRPAVMSVIAAAAANLGPCP